jgi:multidrug efflux pump
MILSDTAIRRPVLTTVVSSAIVLAGWLGYRNLAVRELPNIDYPIVSVTTVLLGANPQVVETEVTEVLEEEINSIEGLETLTSVSGEGTSVITAEFALDRDIDVALQDVRDKISRVRGELPDDAEDPVVQKLDPEARPIIWLAIRNPGLDLTDVNDYAENYIKERLQTLRGVGSVIIGGEKRFAVRVRLDPRKMAGFGLGIDEVVRALQTGNVEIPSGRVESRDREFSIRTQGELPTPESFNELIVAWRDGAPVHLGDVGIAEAGVENERTLARFDSEPTVGLGIIKQSDANTVAVSNAVLAEVETIRENLPPGYTITEAVNSAEFIEQSLHEVQDTILVAFILVVLVIFLFLRSGRATTVPSLAIPVSVVGTFAVLWALNFSINTLTLLALVLSIGIVVDDAIVVLENIYRHMEEGETPKEAARKGTAEIAFAVIAISLTLVIVFLPIGFLGGIVGRLFREFGLTVAVAVLISAFVALTLTPMLSSRFLRPEGENRSNRLLRVFERALEGVTRGFRAALDWALGHRWLVTGIAVAAFATSMLVVGFIGREFVPPEDRGQFLTVVTAPEGSTLEYTDSYLRQIERIIRNTEGVEGYFSAIGLGFGGPPKVNEAILFTRLEKERSRDVFQIMGEIRGQVASLSGVDVFLIAPTALTPTGFQKPLQFVIQSRDLDRLASVADELLARARQIPGLWAVDTDLELNKPQLSVTIDRAKAASLGLSVADIARALQVLYGGRKVTQFERGSNRYEVIVQLQDAFRVTPRGISQVYVRSAGGDLVQLTNVVTVKETVGPSQINHRNRLRSVTLDANLEGIPLGEGLDRVRRLAQQILPSDFSTTVAGQSEDLQKSISSLLFGLLLAIVGVYLVLAGQFESFLHPLTIMLALPLALFGAVLTLAAVGMTINIYSFIGIIMLMGLVTKNSILLVDYTNTLRRRGLERRDAVLQAAVVRLRPILMTSLSIIFGVMPIALALGAGAESRRPLGVAVIGGMFASTALTLFVVPVFYLQLDDAVNWVGATARRLWPGGQKERLGEVSGSD